MERHETFHVLIPALIKLDVEKVSALSGIPNHFSGTEGVTGEVSANVWRGASYLPLEPSTGHF